TFLRQHFQDLVNKHSIDTVIECGTYLGSTTKQLSGMVKQVYTIEINKEFYNEAKINLGACENVLQFLGNTIHVLPKVLEIIPNKKNLLIFVDSHWLAHNPLIEELAIIAIANIQPCIIVHDFKVPDHPELGFDSYNGQDYDYAWIEYSLSKIYPEGYNYYYNSEAIGARRGVIFIEPIQ